MNNPTAEWARNGKWVGDAQKALNNAKKQLDRLKKGSKTHNEQCDRLDQLQKKLDDVAEEVVTKE